MRRPWGGLGGEEVMGRAEVRRSWGGLGGEEVMGRARR